MAGNTKFLGFERDSNVVLERWGGRAVVNLNVPDPVQALRSACYRELPKEPRQHQTSIITFLFNEGSRPAIEASLDPDRAKLLHATLQEIIAPSTAVREWIAELELAIAAFDSYFDKTNEPGVDDEASSGL
jgi:hypothetical protein